MVRPLGIGHGGDIQRGGRLSGPEGRSSIRGRIPIAIIAVGLSSGFKRKNALGENVIIQSIGASSGVIVAGPFHLARPLYPARQISGDHGQFLRVS